MFSATKQHDANFIWFPQPFDRTLTFVRYVGWAKKSEQKLTWFMPISVEFALISRSLGGQQQQCAQSPRSSEIMFDFYLVVIMSNRHGNRWVARVRHKEPPTPRHLALNGSFVVGHLSQFPLMGDIQEQTAKICTTKKFKFILENRPSPLLEPTAAAAASEHISPRNLVKILEVPKHFYTMFWTLEPLISADQGFAARHELKSHDVVPDERQKSEIWTP